MKVTMDNQSHKCTLITTYSKFGKTKDLDIVRENLPT